MSVIIIGGGISGQLVQFCVPEAEILDWGRVPKRRLGSLTRMFGANYLWEKLPNIPCTEFSVVTHVDGQEATHESIRRYKEKIGKTFDQLHWDSQFQPLMKGYDITTLPKPRIRYESRVKEVFVKDKYLLLVTGEIISYDTLISTIPLYALMEMCHIKCEKPFQYRPIFVRIEDRPLEAPYPLETWYVNYLSDPDITPYRYTDRNGERHYEGLTSMGKIPTRKITPGKIYPNPGIEITLELLRENNIYCFGRFANWNPEELLHDTFKDINNWASSR